VSIEQTLTTRSDSSCELCTAKGDLAVYAVPPQELASSDNHILLCPVCKSQVEGAELDPNHWRCLNDSMWSQVPVVQVMAYRMLKRLSTESWAQDAIEMLYLDDETRKWAELGLVGLDAEPALDSNGTALAAGDSVTLIKDLDVKGANFTAKRGTMVRGISLTDDPKYIEGKINGQRIVIVAAYVKKA
jgi:protein PhnA